MSLTRLLLRESGFETVDVNRPGGRGTGRLFEVGQQAERPGRRVDLERAAGDLLGTVQVNLDVGRVASVDPDFGTIRDGGTGGGRMSRD